MRHVKHVRQLSAPVLLGRSRNGSPIWSMAGGAEDDDEGGDGDDDEDEDGEEDGGDDNEDDDDDAELGAAGEKALKAWKDRAKAAERENKQLKRAAPKPKPKAAAGDGDGDEDDPEAIREQARQEAQAEVARDRALDKLETRAAKTFADPEDARALLADRADDFLDDEGKPDVEAINEALEELLENKPHLAAQGGKWKGGGDGGARRSKPSRAKSIGEAVNRRYAPSS